MLEVAFVALFATFIASINRKYVNTFFSTTTAKQFRIQGFREAQTDRAKATIFKCHQAYYAEIRGEIEQWVQANWASWNEEKSEWFNDRVKASVPKDMIPVVHEDAREPKGLPSIRKSSITIISETLVEIAG